MPTKESLLRTQFFDFVYGDKEGYACICVGHPSNQNFFKWPGEKDQITSLIEGARTKNVWFGVNLLENQDNTKDSVLPTNIIWADLDTCNPAIIDPAPQVIIQSSPDRYQALWRLTEELPASLAEEYARRIYIKYRDNGVDSGWNRNRILRVPFTINFKYQSMPEVLLLQADEERIDPSVFENLVIEQLHEAGVDDQEIQMPDLVDLPTIEQVLYAYRHDLKNKGFVELFTTEPDEDWSGVLWRILRICYEVGMSREETFVVGAASKSNKYERDKRPIVHLWMDVVKAHTIDLAFSIIEGELDETLTFPQIINDDEFMQIEDSFINKYVRWANSTTDANEQYHELCGTILLSALLADKLHLNMRHGKVVPNLWGLVLGETTLTRKTTSMDMAMKFITESEPETIVSATDSSAEGLLSALSQRHDKVSIFYRDEVSGFFSAMSSKSYLSGMAETLTKLYDVPAYLPRQLRKETIVVQNPVFIFFGGGIRERVYESLDQEMFFSGFLPRFLTVSGESNVDNIEWMGPATTDTTAPREDLKNYLLELLALYRVQVIPATIMGQEATVTKEVECNLTPEAWEKMRSIEQLLVRAANVSAQSEVALPTYTRMSVSLLKMAMLYAASRQEPDGFDVTVELKDVLQAGWYIQKWAPHTVHMMSNIGTTTSERQIQKILKAIRTHPGVTRAEIMRRHRLQSMPAKIIFQTLEERGLIRTKQSGRGYKVFPV